MKDESQDEGSSSRRKRRRIINLSPILETVEEHRMFDFHSTREKFQGIDGRKIENFFSRVKTRRVGTMKMTEVSEREAEFE